MLAGPRAQRRRRLLLRGQELLLLLLPLLLLLIPLRDQIADLPQLRADRSVRDRDLLESGLLRLGGIARCGLLLLLLLLLHHELHLAHLIREFGLLLLQRGQLGRLCGSG